MSEIENDLIFDNEYEGTLVLAGVVTPEDQEVLLGKILSDPKKRQKLVKKIFNPLPKATVGKTTSRDDFQNRFRQLPVETREGLFKKQKQLVDTALYVVKDVSSNKIIKMLQDDDNKVIAKSNISGGKLEKGNYFTLKAIQLLYGVTGVGETYADVNFGILPKFIRNGEFKFTANGSILIPSMSCEVFNTTGQSDIRAGYFELENPKMIETQQPMDLEIEWGTNAPANSFVKAVLIGTSVAKY